MLGIDTSAYTTSLAVVNEHGVIWQDRIVLPVAQGSRGLRSQDAVFYHVKNIATLINRIAYSDTIAVISVSSRPRPVAHAYLPTFTVGCSFASALRKGWDCPVFLTSHQEGHIRAGIFSSHMPEYPRYAVLHISGGTTELLSLTINKGRRTIQYLGGSDDLYAGQFVDRIGVALGGPFPSGMFLEALAGQDHATNVANIPSTRPRMREGKWWVSFSGPESHAQRLIRRGTPSPEIARGVFVSVANSLISLVQSAMAPGPLLIVGGVAANRIIREILSQRLPVAIGWKLFYATPELSRDNAVGVALIGLDIRGQVMKG